MRETIRFIQGSPLEVATYSRLVFRATTTSADSCPLAARVATSGASPVLARGTAYRTGLLRYAHPIGAALKRLAISASLRPRVMT